VNVHRHAQPHVLQSSEQTVCAAWRFFSLRTTFGIITLKLHLQVGRASLDQLLNCSSHILTGRQAMF